MRTLKPTLALASLVGFFTAASCTLITDVDRTKIPTDAGPAAGAPGSGGTSGSGGTTGGTSGSSGEGGQNPTGGTGGGAGETTGGTGGTTGGTGGTTGGTSGGTSGTAGTGAVSAVCDQAQGTITLAPQTFLSDGDTFTLNDGVDPKVVFEFDLSGGVASGHHAIAFDGSEDQFGLASLIAQAINGQGTNLLITATFREADNTEGDGAGGTAAGAPGTAAGAPGASGGGGEAGAPLNPSTSSAHVDLVNDLSGALGNVRITDTVGNPNFQTSGMAGGKAVSCGSPASCSTDAECANSCGSDHLCTE